MRSTTTAMLFLAVSGAVSDSVADTFGHAANQFTIEFVTVGEPGNVADLNGAPNPAGTVDYVYRVGKHEVSEDMIAKANVAGGLGITQDSRGPHKPATSVSWFEAAKFVNWLNTSVGSTPAYKFDNDGNFQLWEPGDAGYSPDNGYRSQGARYFLPSTDEWYKAAYFNGTDGLYYDYPTGSSAPASVASGTVDGTAVFHQTRPADITLAGGLSPYGTMGQGGNVEEWEETESDLVNDAILSLRGNRGGAYVGIRGSFSMVSSARSGHDPFFESGRRGFRVASIPEPSTQLLGALAGACLLMWRRCVVKREYAPRCSGPSHTASWRLW